MATQESATDNPHFILVPHMSPGHYIPMIGMAKLLAEHGVIVTIVTTPAGALRFRSALQRSIDIGLQIRMLELQFPSRKFRSPEGCCETAVAELPTMDLLPKFLSPVKSPIEQFLENSDPFPSCIITDTMHVWMAETAEKFQVPRILFDGKNCFQQLCKLRLFTSEVHKNLADAEQMVIPGLPDSVKLTGNRKLRSALERIVRKPDTIAYGRVVNSFEELEQKYVAEIRNGGGEKIWCLGPLSLCHKDDFEKVRGNKSSIDMKECLKWLDSQETGSVIYACVGSMVKLTTKELKMLGQALEGSKSRFIWVIRTCDKEFKEWIAEDGFQERVKERGLLIKGWAPQLLILSHPAVGGFLTHCGWNSTLEGVCAGVPMVTWPKFSDQFFNESFVVQVLKIGLMVRNRKPGEKLGTQKLIKNAIQGIMSKAAAAEKRRKRAKILGLMANRAMKEGGSSNLNLKLFIEDVMKEANIRRTRLYLSLMMLLYLL